MKRSFIELWVGLFVLGGVAAIAILTVRVDGSGFFESDETYRIYAHFENVGNLNVKAPVTIAGVNVGRVSGISVDQESFSARVELSISEEFNAIPVDTSARILTQGLLGVQYVGLEQGAEDIFLKSGDTIEFTQSAFSLEDVIAELVYRFTTSG